MQEASVLHLSQVREHGLTVLYAAGDIDITTAPHLREALDELTGNVVVDLADVPFLESQGLAALMTAQKRLVGHGGDLRLRNPQGSVRRALQLVGVAGWIDDSALS
jgi:anti-sigma B factor antagonist